MELNDIPKLWLGLQLKSRKSEFRVTTLNPDSALTPQISAQ